MDGWMDGWVWVDVRVDVDRHDLFGINALLWPRGTKSGSRAHCSWGSGASRGQGLKGACSVVRADPLC